MCPPNLGWRSLRTSEETFKAEGSRNQAEEASQASPTTQQVPSSWETGVVLLGRDLPHGSTRSFINMAAQQAAWEGPGWVGYIHNRSPTLHWSSETSAADTFLLGQPCGLSRVISPTETTFSRVWERNEPQDTMILSLRF